MCGYAFFCIQAGYPIVWQGSIFRGSALLSAPQPPKQRVQLIQISTTTMPRNKTSNNLDHVKKDPKPSKIPKGHPPRPWPLPKYKPVKIKQPWTHGHGQLPSTTPDDPYAIFSLFFNNETIQALVRHTNEYAFLYPRPENPKSRP